MPRKRSSHTTCCGEGSPVSPDHSSQLHRVRRVRGQLDGVERMITERRYCPDIITQIQAIRSALSSLESKLLEAHLHSCVREAFQDGSHRMQAEKIEEIVALIRRS